MFDFQAVAQQVLPTAHYAYLATSVDDDRMLQVNREGFSRFQLRMRRLVDVRQIDMSVDLFGTRWDTPIVIQPTGSNGAFHPDAELAVARAARAKGHLQMLSTVASTPIEAVMAARGEPIWFQLYATENWDAPRPWCRGRKPPAAPRSSSPSISRATVTGRLRPAAFGATIATARSVTSRTARDPCIPSSTVTSSSSVGRRHASVRPVRAA